MKMKWVKRTSPEDEYGRCQIGLTHMYTFKKRNIICVTRLFIQHRRRYINQCAMYSNGLVIGWGWGWRWRRFWWYSLSVFFIQLCAYIYKWRMVVHTSLRLFMNFMWTLASKSDIWMIESRCWAECLCLFTSLLLIDIRFRSVPSF